MTIELRMNYHPWDLELFWGSKQLTGPAWLLENHRTPCAPQELIVIYHPWDLELFLALNNCLC